jgi:hypothetical protein
MKIFDNVGCEFSYNLNNDSFVLLSALPGHQSLPLDSAGNTVPYLARNIDGKNIDYELGVGFLDVVDNKLIVKDKKISLSSNNNNSVNFTKPGNKQFYIFVHNVNFDNAFNNVFVYKDNFNAESRKSVYVVDISNGYVICNLPDPAHSNAVELEFKCVGDNGSLKLQYQNSTIGLLHNESYAKLLSTGSEWVILYNSEEISNSFVSQSTETLFSTLSDPSGDLRSFQYNDGDGNFNGGSIYQGSNNKILFGSDTENLAKHIVPSSGSYDLVINATKDGSNLIVYGTGNAPGYPTNNLYFSYDGRFGINMPSGVTSNGLIKPSTVLHVFNTLCREGIRLENRAFCYPANITIYDNPFNLRPDNSTIASITFSGKDASSNKIDYANIEAKNKSTSSKLGELNVVVKNGNVDKTALSVSSNRTYIKTDNASLDVNNNNITASGTSLNIKANTTIEGSNLDINSNTVIITGNLRLPSISSNISNPLLSLSSNNTIQVATEIRLPGLNVSGTNLLSTTADGAIVANLPINSFWPYELGEKIGGKDLIWDRYPFVSASACEGKDTQEIDLSADAQFFDIGDQLAIFNLTDGSTQYRTITSISGDGSSITRMNIDTNVNIPSGSNLRLYSVSKGGILTNTPFTSGVVSDATSNIFSTRPNVDTIFNTLGKNIDLLMYGEASDPIFRLDASKTGILINKNEVFEYGSGIPFASGSGLAASLSIGGYIYTDAIKITNEYIQDTDRLYSSFVDISGAVIAVSGTTFFVNANDAEDEANKLINKVIITPNTTLFTQPIVIATGSFSSLISDGFASQQIGESPKAIRISATGIEYLNEQGVPIEGGLFTGPTGFFAYKDSDNIITTFNSKLAVIQDGEDAHPAVLDTSRYGVIHNNSESYLTSSDWFTVNDPNLLEMDLANRGERYVSIKEPGGTGEGGLPPLLYTSRIFIGPPLSSFSGSLLTHNGDKAAYWQPDNFLKAPGAVWNRYPRRAVEVINNETLQFITLDPSKGGTGPVSVEDIKNEFAINETIALYNQNRDVVYVKVKGDFLIDSRGIEEEPSFFKNENDLIISFCPALSEEFIQGLELDLGENDPDNGRLIGNAFSVQKGAYLDMEIEPEATQQFTCNGGDASNSEYRFKPSTFNTISIRPSVFTVFNKTAEDIDFVVYGHRKTLFTRYEPEWFTQDIHGVPIGLNPAFRIHSKTDNSYLGSISSGVFRNTIGLDNVATGVIPDLNAKTTINTNFPYKIASLTGIKNGVLLAGSSSEETLGLEKNFGVVISQTGILLSGINDISYYADLTVDGVTYSDALITKDIVIGPVWTGELPVPYELSLTQKVYAPNYPLTINQLGQVVSMIPPPSPKPPTKPLAVTGVAKNSAIELSWTIPEENGGSAILGYSLQYSTDNGANWVDYDPINNQSNLPTIDNADNGRVLISGIFNNTGYEFRTRAYNSVGLGEFSDPSDEITPTSGILKSPDNFTISGSRPNATLQWNSVTSGNIEFLEYIIEQRTFISGNRNLIDPTTWTTRKTISNIATTGTQIEGLSLGPLYYFSIQAKGRNNGIISLSNRAIITSLGADPNPTDVVPEAPPSFDNPYNFGKMVFSGNCQSSQ